MTTREVFSRLALWARAGSPCSMAIALLLLVAAGPVTQVGTTAPAGQTPAAIIAIHGEIDDYSRDHLYKHFDQAKALGAKTIILDINTYGGMVTAAWDISRYIKRQD